MSNKELPEPIFRTTSDSTHICVRDCRLTLDQARALAKHLNDWADDCNVATVKPVEPSRALFNTCSDPNVYVLEINEQILTDFQKLRKAKREDMRQTILALMEFYSNEESLNIILMDDVLVKRQSYVRFTAQLANYLVHNQTNYTQCKVQFDHLTTRLGIFCRKGTDKSSLSSTFLGSIVASVRAYGSAEVSIADTPISYLGNKAALKHQLTKRLGRSPRIVWAKDTVSVYE